MNDRINYKKINIIIDIAYISIIIFAIYFVFKYLLGIFIPFILGTIICFIAEPTVNMLCARFKIKRSLASPVCVLTVIILFTCIILLFSVVFINQIKLLISDLPDFREILYQISGKENKNLLEKAVVLLKDYIERFDFNDLHQSNTLSSFLNYSSGIFKTMPQFITAAIVTLAYSVILSTSFSFVKSFIKRKFSIKNRILIHQIKLSAVSVLKNYLKSYSILLFITFCELLVAFIIFKIRPSFALAFLISLIDILPIFGIGTVMLPWGVILLGLGNYQLAVTVFTIYGTITVIRQIIEPKIVGDNIGLPAVITLPVMFIGLNLFGIIGLFAAPALATVIYSLHKKGFIKLWK